MNTERIDFTLPRGWHELEDKQLYYFFGLMAMNLPIEQIQAYCLMRWAAVSVVCPYGSGYLLKQGKREFVASTEDIAIAANSLHWLDSVPEKPVRIARVRKHRAADTMLVGVKFEDYLTMENLFQGYLATQQEELLNDMGNMLYNAEMKMSKAERLNVFYWWAALKIAFGSKYPHLFMGSNTGNNNLLGIAKSLGQQLNDAMNAQIRALTKGDITKEEAVLAMETNRALTELDAMAKEAEEMNRKYKK